MDESNATIKIVQEARLHGPDEYTVYTRVKSGDTFLRWKYWRSFETVEGAKREVEELQRLHKSFENPTVIGYY